MHNRDSPLRIGCCFVAQEFGVQRPHRSIPALALAPLAEVPGVEWISLMPNKYLPWMKPLDECVDRRGQVLDWEDTAQVIEHLTLVISVDTAVAHLAASLGVPTWILLPKRADWKYSDQLCFFYEPRGAGEEYQTSIWYPGARLFRQTDPVSWDSVIQTVCKELAAIAQPKLEVQQETA